MELIRMHWIVIGSHGEIWMIHMMLKDICGSLFKIEYLINLFGRLEVHKKNST